MEEVLKLKLSEGIK